MIKLQGLSFVRDLLISCFSFIKKIEISIFLLPLSFYSILSGALIGTIVNITTSLFLSKSINALVAIGILILLIIPGLLIYLYIFIEKIRNSSRDEYDLGIKIKNNLNRLQALVYLILILFVIAILAVYVGLQEFEVSMCQNMILNQSIY